MRPTVKTTVRNISQRRSREEDAEAAVSNSVHIRYRSFAVNLFRTIHSRKQTSFAMLRLTDHHHGIFENGKNGKAALGFKVLVGGQRR